jgi:AraC-like DNA-binding protein
VTLRRPEPRPSEAFARFFRAPVTFGADANVLEFDRAVIDAPLPAAHAELASRSDEVMARELAERGQADLKLRLAALVRERLPGGEPSQDEIARALGIGRRTLQRRLADENLLYGDLVAEVREEMARGLLREGRWSITEIAFSLGFREASSFSRAFRKWTGQTPRQFRG